MEWTKEKMDQVIQELQWKAVTDKKFREELLADPNGTIEKETGMKIDPDYKIRVLEMDPNYQATFILPPMVADEFSADEMDAVAGGSCGANACGYNGCAAQVTKGY